MFVLHYRAGVPGLEEDSHIPAGKLLYKRARQISPKAAYELATRAKSDEELRFYQFIGDMNSQRQKGERTMEGQGKPVIPPIYNTPSNIQRKMELIARCIADIKNTQDYYGWIFANDPWFSRMLQAAETVYEELEKALMESFHGLEPAAAASNEKIKAAGEYLIKKHIGALKELAEGPEG